MNDTAYEIFLNVFRHTIDRVCLLTKMKFRVKFEDKPWITKTLKNSFRKKQKLYEIFTLKGKQVQTL